MEAAVHVIDAGDGASALLASAVMALSAQDGARVVAVGPSAGRAMLASVGLRIDAWASPPCGLMRLAARPVGRAVRDACGGAAPAAVYCWSAEPGRASAFAECARRALRRSAVHEGGMAAAADALRATRGAGTDASAGDRRDARDSIGAGAGSLVVLGAADAPLRANALRLLDVVGRAMLAGADAHLVLPECMPHRDRARRHARGLGLDGRLHIVAGAERLAPWWAAADAVVVTDASPLTAAAAAAVGLEVVSAPGHGSDESSPERRAASARARDAAAASLVAMARARAQSARNASAAST